MIQKHVYGRSDQGQRREQNEDSFLIDKMRSLFAVADGLGGLPGGKEVSQRVVQLIEEAVFPSDDREVALQSLSNIISKINKITVKEGEIAYPFTGFGTTLSIGQIIGHTLNFCHIGDSAIFMLRGGKLEKLTLDHTMESDFILENGESARHLMPREYPHTLTRCMGQSNEITIDTGTIELEPFDRLLFCTDGLNKVVSEIHIQKMLAKASTAESAANSLIEIANTNGGPDNITVIACFIR